MMRSWEEAAGGGGGEARAGAGPGLDLAGVTVGFSIVSLYLENWFEPEEAAEERGGPS